VTSTSETARATECRVRDAGPHRARRGRASTRRSARARVPPSDRESTNRPRERGRGALQLLRHHADDGKPQALFPGTNSERFVVARQSRRDYPLRAEAIAKRGSHTTTMFGNLFGGSGSKSGSKASVSAPGACPESPRRRPRGSRDDVPSPFRPIRASSRTISCLFPRRGHPTELPSRHGTDPVFARPPERLRQVPLV